MGKAKDEEAQWWAQPWEEVEGEPLWDVGLVAKSERDS